MATPKLDTNGKLAVGNIIATIMTAGAISFLGYLFYEVDSLQSFRDQGHRCTSLQCQAIDSRIDLIMKDDEHIARLVESIILEQKRLQLQIDRLEGHDIDSYTEDH